ncbi:hypothetical protein I3842_01G039700 [Carya illinoinensis]|uniref:Uncharacterized protein n=1 Tax=Carya illinoinensis TaxID=32201 RepID=A0A922G1C6_CARIL|nr:hypothetical protein I3842_01G039700 [Carya illinoinensis]
MPSSACNMASRRWGCLPHLCLHSNKGAAQYLQQRRPPPSKVRKVGLQSQDLLRAMAANAAIEGGFDCTIELQDLRRAPAQIPAPTCSSGSRSSTLNLLDPHTLEATELYGPVVAGSRLPEDEIIGPKDLAE